LLLFYVSLFFLFWFIAVDKLTCCQLFITL